MDPKNLGDAGNGVTSNSGPPAENTIWALCPGDVLGPSAKISFSQQQRDLLSLGPPHCGVCRGGSSGRWSLALWDGAWLTT